MIHVINGCWAYVPNNRHEEVSAKPFMGRSCPGATFLSYRSSRCLGKPPKHEFSSPNNTERPRIGISPEWVENLIKSNQTIQRLKSSSPLVRNLGSAVEPLLFFLFHLVYRFAYIQSSIRPVDAESMHAEDCAYECLGRACISTGIY